MDLTVNFNKITKEELENLKKEILSLSKEGRKEKLLYLLEKSYNYVEDYDTDMKQNKNIISFLQDEDFTEDLREMLAEAKSE